MAFNSIFTDVLDGNINDNNVINGTLLDDLIVGDNGKDTIIGGSGKDLLYGNAGNDSLSGGFGDDTINGGDGDDIIDGGFGSDVMDGGAGIDTLDVTFYSGSYSVNLATGVTGFVGETAINFENINTGAGNDTIIGSDVANRINAGAGNDFVDGGAGFDVMDGGIGVDTLDTTFFGGPYLLNMITGATNFVGETAVNFENVNTGAGSDTITGSAVANIINTGAGADVISAGAGNDTIFAGAGKDIMTGGTGNDIYRYTANSDSTVGVGRDVINGFDRGGIFSPFADKIDLSAIDADSLTAGDQAFTFIGTSGFTGGGVGEARYFTTGGFVVIEIDARGDGNMTADLQIQVNSGGINASNFIL
jgi:serralysin